MSENSIIHFQLEANDLHELREFAQEYNPDYSCRPVAITKNDKLILDAYLPENELKSAQRKLERSVKIKILVLENVSELGKQRQKEVGQRNRFSERTNNIPHGLGIKE